jgi:5-methylcytosine-specific restriction protein A
MARRPCLTCGTPTGGTRCPTCHRNHDRTRRPTPNQRGYDATYKAARRAILAGGPACAICHTAPATTIDHITPVSLGGSNELTNLRPACHPCNSGRGNRIG